MSKARLATIVANDGKFFDRVESGGGFTVATFEKFQAFFRDRRPAIHPTADEIEAARSESGGWNKKQLAEWGVPWPPPKGWRAALLAGKPIPRNSAA